MSTSGEGDTCIYIYLVAPLKPVHVSDRTADDHNRTHPRRRRVMYGQVPPLVRLVVRKQKREKKGGKTPQKNTPQTHRKNTPQKHTAKTHTAKTHRKNTPQKHTAKTHRKNTPQKNAAKTHRNKTPGDTYRSDTHTHIEDTNGARNGGDTRRETWRSASCITPVLFLNHL